MSFPVPLPQARASKGRDALLSLVLVLAVVAIYGQTIGYPFISLDDPGYASQNAQVRAGWTWEGWRWAWSTFQEGNWHPLTWLSLMLDSQVYGPDAWAHHLTNLLLHAASVLLLFRWLRVTTKVQFLSALTAFLFAAHPMHVESVAWVAERKDVLSALFFCLTLLAYTRYAWGGFGRMRYFWLAWLFYALGLLAKPMLVTVPPLLLLLDYWPLRRFPALAIREHWRRLVVEKIPFGLLMAASCVVTFEAQRAQAVVPFDRLPMTARAASALLGVGTYLAKTFWPVSLGVYYPYWHGVPPWLPVLWGIVLAALTVSAWRRWQRQPYLIVGWLWFLGMLVPVIGLVQVGGQAVADRYTYLPHIGLFIALCWAGQDLGQRWPRARLWLGGVAAAAAGACLTLSIRQAHFWRSSASLFEHAITIVGNPTPHLYRLYGDALLEGSHREPEAAHAFEQAWRLSPVPRNESTAVALSDLWLRAGRWQEVIDLLGPLSKGPGAAPELLDHLGHALLGAGQHERAEAVFRRSAARFPGRAEAHFGLAGCLRLRGDLPGACDEFEAGLARRDDWLPALTYLAWTYAHLEGDTAAHDRALTLARKAVEVSRGQDVGAQSALAAASAAVGQWPQAVEAAQKALSLANKPGVPPGVMEACQERLALYQQGRLP